MSKLKNIGAERAALSGLVQYGVDVFLENNHFLDINIFSDDKNQLVFSLIRDLYTSGTEKIDLASLVTQAHNAGIYELVCKSQTDQEYLRAIFHFDIDRGNIGTQIKHLYSLYVARKAQTLCQRAYKDLESFDVSKGLSDVLTITEGPLNGLLEEITEEDKVEKVGDSLDEYLDYLENSEIGCSGIVGPWPIFNSVIGSGGLDPGVHLVGARAKALAYGSKVYTKKGPVNIEDINKGDTVSHPFNEDSEVLEVFDFKDIDIYRVSFKDGDYVDCCEDHLWSVYKRYPYNLLKNKIPENKTTKELMNDLKVGNGQENKWDIALPQPVQYDSQEVPIDPYVLGVLLGDGSIKKGCSFHSMDSDIIDFMRNYFTDLGYDVKFERKVTKASTYRVNGFQNKLREAKVFGTNCYNKRVPEKYKYNSVEVRLGILQGLLDTDGTCSINPKNGASRMSFCTVSKQLMSDVKELVTSLGGICSMREQKTTCNNKVFDSFIGEVRFPVGVIPFRLKRKADRIVERQWGEIKRTIVGIEKIKKGNARCIRVSNPDGLFLTDNHVITHNCGKSSIGKEFAVHVAKNNIPTIIIDTELSYEDQMERIIASESDVELTELRNKSYRNDEGKLKRVRKAVENIKQLPLYHKNVSGKDFEYILNYLKRWLHRDVGFTDGKANKHFVVYDYFKLTETNTLKEMQEYQAIGFQMSKLHDFCKIHETPVLSFVQLNRDGITKDSTDVVSQSDRLVWNCVSLSLLKRKTQDEIGADGIQNGNTKMIPLEGRFMTRMDDGDYINFNMDLGKSKVQEISTRSNPKSATGFDLNNDSTT